MPPGYSSKCKACNSAHRPEIDAKLLAGESTRSVSEWLDAEHGETIGHVALANHKLAHLNVTEAAKAKLAEAAPAFEAAVTKVVANAELLDEVASLAMDAARKLAPAMLAPAMAQAVAFGAALREARSAVVEKHELLHGKKLQVETNAAGSDPEELHGRLSTLVALARFQSDARAAREPEPGGSGAPGEGGA